MSGRNFENTIGRVASLHLHPEISGELFRHVDSIELVTQKGIRGNGRFFGRKKRGSGIPSRRQVSLIAREQIVEHAATLGLESIAPGIVRSNIETLGIDLMELLGCHVAIGEAILHFYEPRTPCYKMDLICQGLMELMKDRRQGVMAEVIQSGRISVGDSIRLLNHL